MIGHDEPVPAATNYGLLQTEPSPPLKLVEHARAYKAAVATAALALVGFCAVSSS